MLNSLNYVMAIHIMKRFFKTKFNYIFVLALTFFMFFGANTFDSYAGDINSDEARVIGVASGTFTYKGKTYKAYSSYINELYSYLADDDVDLSADAADGAISYIYDNVKEGIDSGYVYEVKEKEENNINLDEIPDTAPDLSSSEAAKDTAKEASDREVAQLIEKLDKDHEDRAKYTEEKTATQTDATLYVDEDSITVTTDDGEIKLFSNKRIVPKIFTDIMIILGIVLLVINIIIFVVLVAKGCMRFLSQDRRKSKKGHRVRRKIRKVCRNILTVSSAVAIMAICFIIAVSIGFFNNDKIMQTIQSSGYFRYAYTQYVTENVTDSVNESENNTQDIKLISYDEYIVQEKLSISSTFENDKPLDEQEVTDRSIAPYVKRIQLDMKVSMIISFVCCMLALIVACVCNIYMDLRRDRGVKSIAISVFAGTVTVFVAAILLALFRLEDYFFVEPGYLVSFLNDMMDYIIKVFIVIGLFGTAIGASLVGLYKGMRKDR